MWSHLNILKKSNTYWCMVQRKIMKISKQLGWQAWHVKEEDILTVFKMHSLIQKYGISKSIMVFGYRFMDIFLTLFCVIHISQKAR